MSTDQKQAIRQAPPLCLAALSRQLSPNSPFAGDWPDGTHGSLAAYSCPKDTLAASDHYKPSRAQMVCSSLGKPHTKQDKPW